MGTKNIPFLILSGALVFEILFYQLEPEINFPVILLLFSLSLFLLLYQKKFIKLPKLFSFFYAFFFAAQLNSFIHSPTKFQGTLELFESLNAFLIVILSLNLNNNSPSLFWPLIFSSSFWAFVGIGEYTSRKPLSGGRYLLEPFHWPSLAADLFLLVLPAAMSLFFQIKNKSYKLIILFPCIFFLTSAWFLTQSHIWLVILLFLFIPLSISLGYLKQKKLDALKENLKRLTILIILLLALLPTLKSAFGYESIPESATIFQNKIFFQNKNDLFEFALYTLRKLPWWGIGLGNFGLKYLNQQTQPWNWSDFLSNEIFQTAAETGFPGLLTQGLLFCFILIVCVRNAYRYIREFNFLQISTTLSVFLFLIFNLINDFSYRIFPLQLIFFLLFSFLLKDSPSFKLKYKPAILLTSVLILISGFLTLDGFLLRYAQKSFAKKNYSLSEKILVWLTKRPDYVLNPRVLLWLSANALGKQNPPKAISYLEEAKKSKPFDDEIDYQIASIFYAQKDINTTQLILEEKLKEKRYISPNFYFSLAKIYLEKGKKEEAFQILQSATQYFKLPQKYKNNPHTLQIIKDNDNLRYIEEFYMILYEETKDEKYLKDYLNEWVF